MSTMTDSTAKPIKDAEFVVQGNVTALVECDSSGRAESSLNSCLDQASEADITHANGKVETKSLDTIQANHYNRIDSGEEDVEKAPIIQTEGSLDDRSGLGEWNAPSSEQTLTEVHKPHTEADSICGNASQYHLVHDEAIKEGTLSADFPTVGLKDDFKQQKQQLDYTEPNEVDPSSEQKVDIARRKYSEKSLLDDLSSVLTPSQAPLLKETDLHSEQSESESSSPSGNHEFNKASQPPSQFDVPSVKKSAVKPDDSVEALQGHSTADIVVNENTAPADNAQAKSQDHKLEQQEQERWPHSSKTIEIATTSIHEIGIVSSLSKNQASTELPNSQEHRSDIANIKSQNEKQETLRLLHFDDDLSQYDGTLLWTSMFKRCWAHFQGPQQGRAVMSLQRLRRGKSDANTEFKVLCELSEYHKTFCKTLQNFLGILEGYQGASLFKAPFTIVKPSQGPPGLEKSQGHCLTCMHKGRNCSGSRLNKTRCLECHIEKSNNADTTTEADECYLVYESFGIFSYSDAVDFFAYSDVRPGPQKRKATEDVLPQPTKRARRSRPHLSTAKYFRTSQGPYPIHMENFRCPEPELGSELGWIGAPITRRLIDEQGNQLTIDRKVRGIIELSKFKSIRAGLEWSMWELIRSRGMMDAFTSRPKYSFYFCRKIGGTKYGPLGEEWFLCQDRVIRQGATKWLDKAEFIGEVEPATQTP